MSDFLKRLLRKLPPGIYRDSPARFFMVLVVAGTLTLQWWTWFRRYPLIAQKQQEVQQVLQLEGEVQRLAGAWSEDAAAQTEAKLKQAREQLFTGNTGTTACLDQLQQPTHAPTLAIKVQLQEGLPHPQSSDTLTIVPTFWEVTLPTDKPTGKPAVGTPTVSMQGGLLKLLQELTTNQPKRMDLVELSVSGDGSNMTRARVGFRLWFLKEKGEKAVEEGSVKQSLP
ncbi:MAG: hypothetical protein ACAH88_20200 [Roseimicrobium sp.]